MVSRVLKEGEKSGILELIYYVGNIALEGESLLTLDTVSGFPIFSSSLTMENVILTSTWLVIVA